MKRGWLYVILMLAFVGFAFQARRMRLFVQPKHFPAPVYGFAANPLSAEKIALGRVLFYDPILSADSTISCASCHSPFNAFAHTDHDLSHGIRDQIGTRNAPALFNLAWHPVYMWDGAANHLDMQALAPISHPKEMAESIENVVAMLERQPMYSGLFAEAFGYKAISGESILKALAQFQLTLVSAGARYDSVQAGKAKFTAQEQNGYRLFRENCNACHREPLFSTYAFANNGLPIDTTLQDVGRVKISQHPQDSLQFKIPSLRNLTYSFPYMHDGRFKKLGPVINHYTSGIQNSATLSPILRKPIVLSSTEKVDLIAFLLTLNDRQFVFDPKHQFPREVMGK